MEDGQIIHVLDVSSLELGIHTEPLADEVQCV